MRYVTFSFDDGYRDSSVRTAALFEERGLVAEFHVLSEPSTPPAANAAAAGTPMGDFGLWRELSARGHVIQPHGTDHTNKTQIPFAEARAKIERCLEAFHTELPGFDPRASIFGFPYNASTPELEAWLPSAVRAFRTGGPMVNPLPNASTVKLTTGGSADAEPLLERSLEDLLARDSGWLIYNAHGLDDEGWGPLRTEFLARTLDRLLATPSLTVLPARDVLAIGAAR